MYELSRDYLNKLIAKSGIKVGTAKATAVAAIIELIDENALDGLIKSIRVDYECMTRELCQRNSLQTDLQYLTEKLKRLKHDEELIRGKIQEERATLAELFEQKKEAVFDASIAGCSDDEKSRILAYKAAVEIGKEQFSGRISDKTMEQILRSASNVAANWIRQTSDADNPAT